MCRVCLVNLHLHYVVELNELEHDMEHDYNTKLIRFQYSNRWNTTNLIPWDQISLFNFESIRTSDVFIIFSANFFNSLTARGARFLKALEKNRHQISNKKTKISYTPCKRLCKLTVYSRVTTSFVICFLLPAFSPFLPLVLAIFRFEWMRIE